MSDFECNASVCAVIVCYNPLIKSLCDLLTAITPQVGHTIVIDNSSFIVDIESALSSFQHISHVKNQSNLGVAKALNQGLAIAQARDYDFVLLLDQDSLPAKDFVDQLVVAISTKLAQGERVAAVGPAYENSAGGQSPNLLVREAGQFKRVCCGDQPDILVEHLITSGSLIPVSIFDFVGDMEGKLFIDYVDIEWCFRARSLGYAIYAIDAAKMTHSLGDSFTYLGERRITLHSSVRHYYIVRNGLWLLMQPWVPKEWKAMDFKRLLVRYLMFSLFFRGRLENFKMMTRGVWDALHSRMGPYAD